MQIVIDIPEEIYNSACATNNVWDMRMAGFVCAAIANGAPLPKGHGRIADMDEVIKCIKDVNGDDAIWAIGLIEWACGKRTIIEAESEEI